MSASRLRMAAAAALTLAASAIAAASGCSLGVGDAICTEDSVYTDKDDDCPYGPPGGPQPRKKAVDCEDIQFTNQSCGTATWEAVYGMFTDPARGGCSNGAVCHGVEPGKKGVFIPAENPSLAYDNLGKYLNAAGEPYLKANDPTSWVVCNVTGQPGSAAMPPQNGLIDPADIQLVKDWASCGLPGPGAGGTGGQGGN